MAEDAPLFQAGGYGSLTVGGKYDPGITPEIDAEIRNMPGVIAHCLNKAMELLRATGSNNFEIVLSTRQGATVYSDATDALGRRHYTRGGGKTGGSTNRSPEHQRPRAYVAPANSKGIHEELSDAVLLKAAMGMAGK